MALIRRRKKTLIVSLFVFVVLIHLIRRTSRDDLGGSERASDKVLCVSNHLTLRAVATDGFVMSPYVRPTEWAHFNGSSSRITDQRIFFHETGGQSQLSLIQCCALESTAKYNPDKLVQLFMRPIEDCASSSSGSSTSLHNPVWLEVLSQFKNVEVILLNEDHYFAGSMLEDWYKKAEWRKSKYEKAHLSDYIRILTLGKRGGMYLDIDIIITKPLRGNIFRNFLVYGNEAKSELSNGVIHLEHGHWLAIELMKTMAKEYDPLSYIYNGPDVISEVMNRICGLVAGDRKTNRCSDVQLLPDKAFYPILSILGHLLFLDGGNQTDARETLRKIRRSYGVHLWNSLAPLNYPLNIRSKYQPVAVIAREHCPLTVARAAEFKLL